MRTREVTHLNHVTISRDMRACGGFLVKSESIFASLHTWRTFSFNVTSQTKPRPTRYPHTFRCQKKRVKQKSFFSCFLFFGGRISEMAKNVSLPLLSHMGMTFYKCEKKCSFFFFLSAQMLIGHFKSFSCKEIMSRQLCKRVFAFPKICK